MNLTQPFLPIDRRRAIARNQTLPERAAGAVLFADISGFTPLTAVLLHELGPKRGPEVLTRRLNAVYDALITEVHRYGGSVIGFSGDAITCWLAGDSGARAVTCGLAMQQAMRAFAQTRTPAGSVVSLGMKVAVAAGTVRRFLVGDPAIQQIDTLAGAALDRMAAAEQWANSGEVLVSPEVAAALGSNLRVASVRQDAVLGLDFAVVAGLAHPAPPAPWPELEPTLTTAQVRPWLLAPVFEQLQRGQAHFLAEIRPAVALFLRFAGINFETDPRAGGQLDAYLHWVQHTLARYAGTLLQLTIGDKGCYLYAAFGAPVAYGDEAARAVASALDLQRPPDALAFVGPVQIGLSQGRMRTGAYGGAARRTYGVLGDEVNMAARLMGKAQPGQIIVSQRVADSAGSQFALQSLGSIAVKGKTEPIAAAQVTGRRRIAGGEMRAAFAGPLLGREAELAELDPVLLRAAGGAGQVARVQGPAGIGKSHLLAEFSNRAAADGWRVAAGSCQSTGQDIAYHPWRQIFWTLLGADDAPAAGLPAQIEAVSAAVSAVNPDWAVRLPLLGDLLDLPIPDNAATAAFDPQTRQEALFALVVEWLGQWAQAQPLLLVVEDIHWLDETSRGLLLAVARAMTDWPALLLVSHRPPTDAAQPLLSELGQPGRTVRLNLADLPPDGVAAAVAQQLQARPSALLLDLVSLQARGNPFFVREVVSALREWEYLEMQPDGTISLGQPALAALHAARALRRNADGTWELNRAAALSAANLGLPDSIQGLVLARLDRLPEEQRLTLKVASVIGRIFQFQLLAGAHPLQPENSDLLQQVDSIERRDFTRLETPPPHLAHSFTHNITRDTAYESLLERQQRDLHRAVAEALEAAAPEAVESLAFHFIRANVPEKMRLYLPRAARKARREYANETALHYFEQALALEDRWEWRREQAQLLHILGRREAERAALARLEAHPGTPDFESAYLWGQYFEATGEYPEAQAAVERALVAAQSAQDWLAQIRCLSQLGLIARRQGSYRAARDWYRQAYAAVPEQADYSNREARAFSDVLNGLGTVLRQLGEYEPARNYFDQALIISQIRGDQLGEAQALNNLGVTFYYQRDFASALAHHRQALHTRQTIGDRPGVGMSLYNLALISYESGDYGQAQHFFSRGLDIQQATGNRWEEVNIWNGLGNMHQELGDLTTARDCFERGMNLAEAIGDRGGQAYLMVNLGLAAAESGDVAEAESRLAAGLQLARREADNYLISSYLNYQSRVSLATGQLAQAEAQARESLAIRRSSNMELLTADNLAVLADIHLQAGQPEQAAEFAGQSLALLQRCGGEGPEFPQQDYFVCHQVFLAVGQAARAQKALQAAHALVMARADKIVDPAQRESFLQRVAVNREILAAAGSI